MAWFLINQKRWCNCQELWCQVPTCLHHLVSTPKKYKLYAVFNCSQIGLFFNFVILQIWPIFPKIRKTSPTLYTLKMIISQLRNIRSPVSVHLAKSARLHPNPKIKAAIFYWVGPTLLIWVPCLWLPIVRTHKLREVSTTLYNLDVFQAWKVLLPNTRADLDDGMPFLSQSQIIQDLSLPQKDDN